jgi:hypothetical protein
LQLLPRAEPHGTASHCTRTGAEIGDVLIVDGHPWTIIEKDPPFQLRRIERIICVPAPAGSELA